MFVFHISQQVESKMHPIVKRCVKQTSLSNLKLFQPWWTKINLVNQLHILEIKVIFVQQRKE